MEQKERLERRRRETAIRRQSGQGTSSLASSAQPVLTGSCEQILRNYRDDPQAVALIRELENFTADPRDLVQSGHSLTEGTRATAGRQRSSTSRGSSEDEDDSDASSSSVPPASLGPYVSKSQLPAPVSVQGPPSDRRSIPDSAKAGPSRGRGRTPRRAEQHYDDDDDDDDESSTESVDQSLVPPSRSAPSRAFSHQGGHLPPPPPLPLPPHPGQLRHHVPSAGGGSSIYGPARSFNVATPAGMISGVSTPAGAGTPLPPGGRYPPSAGYNAPPSLGTGHAPWAQGGHQPAANLPPIPPSRYRPPGPEYTSHPSSHQHLQVVGANPQPIPAIASPSTAQQGSGSVAVRDHSRSLEQALDTMQTTLAALQEQMVAMERQRATERHHSGVVATALRRTMRRILYLMGLQRTSPSAAREPEFPLTTGRLVYAVIAGFFGAARQVAVDAVLVGLMVGLFLRWRRGQPLVSWRDVLRWMVGNGGSPAAPQRRLEG